MPNTIPTLDLQDTSAPSRDALGRACRDWGAFLLRGHGIDPVLIRGMRDQRQQFFAQPRERKQQVLRSPTNAWGYYDQELTKRSPDWKEVFDFGRETDSARDDVGDGQNRWPDALPGFRESMLDYLAECERVAFQVLERLCISLDLPGGTLSPFFGDHTSFLRLNHYPPCAEAAPASAETMPESGHLGVHHHTDAGALTVVEQSEVPGLQIERGGKWHTVPSVDGSLVVHLADMLQVWSNDRYTSPLHRVILSPGEDRYSAPYFFNPAYDCDCRPLEALVGPASPARYRPVNWGEFRRARATGDYADFGEEIQIAQFAIPSA